MRKLLLILLYLFFNFTHLYSGELDERNQIINQASQLFQKADYKSLATLAKTYRTTEERTSSGRWKLRFLYYGINKAITPLVKNKYHDNWDSLEKELLTWTKSQPKNPTAHISYTIFLTNKAWMYRGTNLAKNTPKENWNFFHHEIDKAVKYLLKYKNVASKDPHWYTTMLNLTKLASWNKFLFYNIVKEAINKYPHYYSIYAYTLYYLDPKWNNYSTGEIKKISKIVLNATNDRNGAYARYYWMVKDILGDFTSTLNANIDWSIMTKSMQKLIDTYPTQYNINGFAYISCLSIQKETMQKYLNKIEGQPLLDIWKNQKNFDTCYNNINNINKSGSIPIVPPNQVINYIKNNQNDKPLLIFFTSNKMNNIKYFNEVEKLSKKYKDKLDFLSVYISPMQKYSYPSLRMKFFLKNKPFALRLVYKQKILLRLNRKPKSKYMHDFFKLHIDTLLDEINNTNILHTFKENIYDESSFINTEENIRINLRNYLKTNSIYKAIAIASNMKEGKWIYQSSLNTKSQKLANSEALKKCKNAKLQHNTTMSECKLYMVGNNYVLEKDNTFTIKEKPINNQVKSISKNIIKHKNNLYNVPINVIEDYINKNSDKLKPLLVYFDLKVSHKKPSKGLELIFKKYKDDFNIVSTYFDLYNKDSIHKSIKKRFDMRSYPSIIIIHKNKTIYNKGGNLNNKYTRKEVEKMLSKYLENQLKEFYAEEKN